MYTTHTCNTNKKILKGLKVYTLDNKTRIKVNLVKTQYEISGGEDKMSSCGGMTFHLFLNPGMSS